jgi:methylenetetrahydrofolate reductase (NADPH)
MSDLQISFEFFPPKNDEAQAALGACVGKLEALSPQFVSVTYGAGGSTRDRSLATVESLLVRKRFQVAAHMTCVGASKREVNETVLRFAQAGVKHFVALRGDPPEGVGSQFKPHPEGYKNGADLVAGIKALGDFEISVSAYPEKHPESFTLEVDLAMLAAKEDNGASRAITQFFFDASAYLRYVDRARARGIQMPIVPGILPVTNFARVCEFARSCGASIPASFARRFEGLDHDPEARHLVAAMVAAEQVEALRREGVTAFHIYTLNRPELAYALARMLGVATQAKAA